MSSVGSSGSEAAFRLVTPERGAAQALGFAWQVGPGRWRAWSPVALRILRRFYAQHRALLDLSDDVVSSLYDPQGRNGVPAIFALARPPETGLMQLYGAYADGRTPEEAAQRARRGTAYLVAALRGRFRQSRFTALTLDESQAFVELLLRSRYAAAVIGQVVPRLKPGAGSMNAGGITGLITADAQEQLEALAAGVPDPFAFLVQAEPMLATDIRRMLDQTAQALTRYLGLVKQNESASFSMVLPTFLNPVAVTGVQRQRTTGAVADSSQAHRQANEHELAVGRSQTLSASGKVAKTHEVHSGEEGRSYREGQHLGEHITEHEEARVALERDYADNYSLHRDYHAVEGGTVRTDETTRARSTGSRQQDVHEDGTLQAHEAVSTQGVRSGTGSRSGSGARVDSFTSFSQVTTTDHRTLEGHMDTGLTSRLSGEEHRFAQGGYVSHQQEDNFAQGSTASNVQALERTDYSGSRSSDLHMDSAQRSIYVDSHDAGNEGVATPERIGGGVEGGGVIIPANIGAFHRDVVGERGSLDNVHRTTREAMAGNAVSQRDAASEAQFQRHEATLASTTGDRTAVSTEVNVGSQQVDSQRTYGGEETLTNVHTEVGGGTRTSNFSYAENYGYNEAYRDSHTTDSARNWTSAVRQQMDYTTRSQGERSGVQSFRKVYGGTYDETGSRSGHLSQFDQITSDRDLHRSVDRSITGHRDEQFEGFRDSRLLSQEARLSQEEKVGEGRSFTEGTTQAQQRSAFDGATTTRFSSRSIVGPSGGSIIAGLGFSRQYPDARRQIVAELLQQQVDRLKAGLDTGFFTTQAVLLAPDEEVLAKLAAAAVAAWREENVVVPVAVRAGDEELWRHAVRWQFDERKEALPGFNARRFVQGMTSNELAALTHPLRMTTGTISASLPAWPAGLSRRRTQGELPLGFVVDVNGEVDRRNVFRIRAKDLMHMLFVGASGSGKSVSAMWVLKQIVEKVREEEDEDGHWYPVRVPTSGPLEENVEIKVRGRMRVGITVFDPTGEWRKMAKLIGASDFRFFSLTDPQFHPLRFNPLRIPSPYIPPSKWAAAIGKRWALAFPTGATGFNLVKSAVMDLYRERGVVEEPQKSAELRMADLYEALQAKLEEAQRKRDQLSAGVLSRICDKMEEFLPGGMYYEAFGKEGGTSVEAWVDPHRLTVLEGDFGEDDGLKKFVIGLLVSAIYQHAALQYAHLLRERRPIPEQILFIEEAHVVMEADGSGSEAAKAVESGAGLWNDIADRGRKYGLYLFTAAQHWDHLPSGVITSSRMAVALAVDTVEDAKTAVAKLGKLPGTSSVDEYSQWTRLMMNLPVGVGLVRMARKPIQQEAAMEVFPVQFPNISSIQPPSDEELDYTLRKGRTEKGG